MKLRPRDNLDQYIVNSAVRPGGCLSLSDGGRRALNGRPTTSFEKGRRQAAKSLGGGRSSPTSPASRLPTPSTKGARVGSRPPQGNEDDRISVHRVHKVSSGRSARIEPSALCLKKLACCAVVARQRGEARRHELAPDRYLHLPAGWNRRILLKNPLFWRQHLGFVAMSARQIPGSSPHVAKMGVGIGMSFASFRRFWAVAASRNSSLAPLGPRKRNRSSRRMRFR